MFKCQQQNTDTETLLNVDCWHCKGANTGAKMLTAACGHAQVERPAIVLVQLFAVGYYHFLLEVMSRLLIALGYTPSGQKGPGSISRSRGNASNSANEYSMNIRDNAVVVVPTYVSCRLCSSVIVHAIVM